MMTLCEDLYVEIQLLNPFYMGFVCLFCRLMYYQGSIISILYHWWDIVSTKTNKY